MQNPARVGYNPTWIVTVIWNLPNSLTIARILMVPLLVAVLLTRFSGSEFWGLGIFLLAVLTDLFDGMIARRTKSVTDVGKLLDPIADKLLISAAFISLVELGLAPAWMVVVVIGRDFAVSGLRQVAQARGVLIEASWWGKLKTLTQVVAISMLIVYYQLGVWALLAKAVLWLAIAMTLGSLISYFTRFWRVATGGT